MPKAAIAAALKGCTYCRMAACVFVTARQHWWFNLACRLASVCGTALPNLHEWLPSVVWVVTAAAAEGVHSKGILMLACAVSARDVELCLQDDTLANSPPADGARMFLSGLRQLASLAPAQKAS